jgi:serine protease
MKKNKMAGFIIFLIISFFAFSPEWSWAVVDPSGNLQTKVQKEPGIKKQKFKDGELLVRFKKGVTKEKAKEIHAKHGSEIIRSYSMPADLYHVKVKKNTPLDEIIDTYTKDPDVLYAEPNFIYTIQTVPNDPSFGSLWGLNNTGRDSDINAPEAWDIVTGSPDTIVAVIDTGVDYKHQDLLDNIWVNPGEIPGNGIDDDGNGYIDDVHGINAITGKGDPMDDHYHGTHVSGTIAASGNNGIGVAGINWNARIIGCKFLDSDGYGNDGDAIECLNYLYDLKTRTNNPVDVVLSNNSWGNALYSQALADAIDAQRRAGILFIAAAGNYSMDNDFTPFYPCSYYLPNVVSVAASDSYDRLSDFTHYGAHSVHVAAPGEYIYSTFPNNQYEHLKGTSMATPHVSGLAALLKSQDLGRDWKTIRNLMLAGGQDNATSAGKTITGKRIRAADTGGVGSLTCNNQVVGARLRPVASTVTVPAGTSLGLSYLHINCGIPNGDVTVAVSDGTQIVLNDDGHGFDQEAYDGVYSAQWTPSTQGTYTLTFPGNDIVTVRAAWGYHQAVETTYNYRTMIGASTLNLGDDESVERISPFPIQFAGDSEGFTSLHISSNGHINFTKPNPKAFVMPLPTAWFQTLVAPLWDDLDPASGGMVLWNVLGVSPNRELVVEWYNVPHYGTDCTGSVNFQVVFFENSPDILFNYADVGFGSASCSSGASATVGIQMNPSQAVQYSYNTASLRDGLALLWKPVDLIANAGQDRFVAPSAAVALDGTKSMDRNGTIVSYAWSQTSGTAVTLSGADAATPHFTAPDTGGTLSFQLTVIDDSGKSASDSMNVVVTAPPVANAGADQTVLSSAVVTLDGSGSYDPDGTIASYEWLQIAGAGVKLSGANTAAPSFSPTYVPGTLSFKLTIKDNSGQSASDTVNITVATIPVAKAGQDRFVLPESVVSLNGTGSYDPDGTIVNWQWQQISGDPVSLAAADTSVANFTAPSSGSFGFRLTVTDNNGLTGLGTVNIRVNQPPIPDAGADITVETGTPVTLSAAASYDGDGMIVSYRWVQTGGGYYLTLSGADTAQPGFTPTSPGNYTFPLDSNGLERRECCRFCKRACAEGSHS